VRGISLSHAGGRWKLALDEGTVKLRLTLSLVRPGATATDWPVGTAKGPGSPTYRSTFDWSVPVATARASGWIGYDGHRSAISGWRGYLDHTWGRFSLGDGLMQHWDWAVAQSAQDTWIVNGFETGPGLSQWKPHDTLWAGVLLHSGSRGTSFCRARVVRTGWTTFYAGVNGYVYPRTLAASCGGFRVTFSRRQNAYDYERGWAESSARTSVGGYGLFVEQNRVGS
jgi:hypothetical protein